LWLEGLLSPVSSRLFLKVLILDFWSLYEFLFLASAASVPLRFRGFGLCFGCGSVALRFKGFLFWLLVLLITNY
jgi:hypothetical protein